MDAGRGGVIVRQSLDFFRHQRKLPDEARQQRREFTSTFVERFPLRAHDAPVPGKNIESRPHVTLHQRAVESRAVSALAERICESALEQRVARLHERLSSADGGRVERIVGAVAALDALKQACAEAKFGIYPNPPRDERRPLTEILREPGLYCSCKQTVKDAVPRIPRIWMINRLRLIFRQGA